MPGLVNARHPPVMDNRTFFRLFSKTAAVSNGRCSVKLLLLLPHAVPAFCLQIFERLHCMKLRKFRIPHEIIFIIEKIQKSGKKAYIVGGAVRDYLLGRSVANDFDIATDADPQDIMRMFNRVVPTGIKHGTVTVLIGSHSVEVTTFRLEKGYSDSRRPDAVEFTHDLIEDLSRRDFTMNAIAYDISNASLIDPFNGQVDIAMKTIRTVGNPLERFSEDGLRPLRAVRFASQLGFSIQEETYTAIPACIEAFKKVSWERIRDELSKILLSPVPSVGLRLLESTGLMAHIIPELLPGRNCQQKGMHVFDVLDHGFLTVDACMPDLELRLAALFHDAGKPFVKSADEQGIPTFYNHDKKSVELAAQALRRLKYPNDCIDTVCHLIALHMFHYEDNWTDAAVRRFIAKAGEPYLERLFLLRLADGSATTGIPADPRSLVPFRKRIDAILTEQSALQLKDLKISGNDLMAAGIPKGPVIGKILHELLETVLDDPSQNERETLLKIAGKLKSKYL